MLGRGQPRRGRARGTAHGSRSIDQEPVGAVRVRGARRRSLPELAEVIGQREAVEALVVAAAGGHHLLMCGPPGAGKTMLARRLPGILPASRRARRRSRRPRSGRLTGQPVTTLSRTPPFEAPHHSASIAALVGRRVACRPARRDRPGERGRAVPRRGGGVRARTRSTHCASRSRAGAIVIHRAGVTASFPARFQLVLATNPCPVRQLRGQGRIVHVPADGDPPIPGSAVRTAPRPHRHRAVARARVGRAGDALAERRDHDRRRRVSASRDARRANRGSPRGDTVARSTRRCRAPGFGEGPLAPAPEVRRPLDAALHRGALTLRGYDRVLRVAWSIADIGGRDRLTAARHRSRALSQEGDHRMKDFDLSRGHGTTHARAESHTSTASSDARVAEVRGRASSGTTSSNPATAWPDGSSSASRCGRRAQRSPSGRRRAPRSAGSLCASSRTPNVDGCRGSRSSRDRVARGGARNAASVCSSPGRSRVARPARRPGAARARCVSGCAASRRASGAPAPVRSRSSEPGPPPRTASMSRSSSPPTSPEAASRSSPARAYGIDGAAHRAALAVGGSTVALLAGGVDRPVPGRARAADRPDHRRRVPS